MMDLRIATAYRELEMRAKADGLMNAFAQHTQYGFSNHGQVMEAGTELANQNVTMCVELIAHRFQLENSCTRPASLLGDKVIAYNQIENWMVHSGTLGTLEPKKAAVLRGTDRLANGTGDPHAPKEAARN